MRLRAGIVASADRLSLLSVVSTPILHRFDGLGVQVAASRVGGRSLG
jgi:hypothetical protein